MSDNPLPKFFAACRLVFGDDYSPAAVIAAVMRGDPRMDEVNRIHAKLLDGKRSHLVALDGGRS